MHKYSFTFLLFVLVAAGCSSTYRVSNFSSKEKFYNAFNKFASNKEIVITLNNDSTFIAEGNTRVLNDTLVFSSTNKITHLQRLPVKDIKKISYKNHFTGASIGFLSGTSVGLITGLIGYGIIDKGNTQQDANKAGNFLTYSLAAGFTAGVIWGWISGITTTYIFVP